MADLTTLTAVKQYLVLTSTGSDPLIQSLIPRESRAIERYTGFRFPVVERTGVRLNGTGTSLLMLPDQPILSVSALSIDGVDVPAADSSSGTGYQFDESTLYLASGQRFPMGRMNVQCSWIAGYRDTVDDVIPSGNTPTLWIRAPGAPSTIYSITDDTGTAFVETANAPAAGEYSFNAPNITFNASDAGRAITVDMSYVPADVEQACIEMVGLDLKQRDNLGIRSKTLANESISYEGAGMTESVRQMLRPYRKVAPV